MAATPADVKAINGSTLDDAAIQPFLDAAVCIMDGIAACTTAKNVTQECLDAACAWLAAHLMAMTNVDPSATTVKKETFENYSVERAVGGFSGKGVLSTTYGQTANTLTGGCLLDADKAPAGICFFGGA